MDVEQEHAVYPGKGVVVYQQRAAPTRKDRKPLNAQDESCPPMVPDVDEAVKGGAGLLEDMVKVTLDSPYLTFVNKDSRKIHIRSTGGIPSNLDIKRDNETICTQPLEPKKFDTLKERIQTMGICKRCIAAAKCYPPGWVTIEE